jgi:galactokinase/mevalonate kinase-like predicted kinase
MREEQYAATEVNRCIAADLDWRVIFTPQRRDSQEIRESQVEAAGSSRQDARELFERITTRLSGVSREEIESDIEVSLREVRGKI